MILIAYCEDDPLAANIAAAWAALRVQDQVEVEDQLQRWALWGPEETHIYARVDARRQVLARRVAYVRRFVVGVYDLNAAEIIIVSIDRGPIQTVVRSAALFLGPLPGSLTRNRRWTG